MFAKLYLGELKKTLNIKTLIILSAVILVFFVIVVIFFNVSLDILEGNTEVEIIIQGNNNAYYDVTPQNVDEYITEAIKALEMAQHNDKQNDTNTEYSIKETLTVLRYIKDNSLYGKDVEVVGAGSLSMDKNAEQFVSVFFSILSTIVLIYGIVLSAGIFADEYKSGTIKLVMLKPITRNQLITAKLLSGLTLLFGLMGVSALFAFLYGVVAYGSRSGDTVYMVFNASSVIKSTLGGQVFLEMASSWLNIVAYYILSFTIGATMRKKTVAILISIVVSINVISGILGGISNFIPAFLLSTNTSIAQYFMQGAVTHRLANFYFSASMYLVYNAALLFTTYFVVNKRDIY